MKVLIVPKGGNPYQELLYTRLRKQNPGDRFDYLETTRLTYLFFPLVFLAKRLQGYNVVHIHWLIFHLSHHLPFAKRFSYYYTLANLYWLKIIGYKLVWTVHETVTHDKWTTDDLSVSRHLAKLADGKITHSPFAYKEMQRFQLDTSHTHIIPHGNYIGVYPNDITRSEARRKLGIGGNEFVVLFFGGVRPYKGLENLLEAYTKLKTPNTRLVIAGKCRDNRIAQEIQDAQATARIDFYDAYIEDADVATYFKACDVVCLPFKKITTSGSAILAMSFGKPVITTRTGALLEFPDDVGYLYDPKQRGLLLGSLRQSVSDPKALTRKGKQAKAYAESLSWETIAEQTHAVYTEALS